MRTNPAVSDMARPKTIHTLRTPELIDDIINSLSEGVTLREICRRPNMPTWKTVYDWIRADEELALRFVRARELGHDAISEEIIEILDTPPERCATEFGDKVDPGYVQWQKNRADKRLDLLAKWNSGKYGNKVGVEHSGTVQLADALEAARKRMSEK